MFIKYMNVYDKSVPFQVLCVTLDNDPTANMNMNAAPTESTSGGPAIEQGDVSSVKYNPKLTIDKTSCNDLYITQWSVIENLSGFCLLFRGIQTEWEGGLYASE